MKVRNAMHPGVEWVSPSTTVKELARLMREHDIGALPVGENDRLVGMVTDRDLVCRALAEGCNPDKVTAREIMTKGITYCLDNEELGDAIRIMEQKQIRRLPVINGEKRMVGILSLGDITAAQRELCGEVLNAVAAHHH